MDGIEFDALIDESRDMTSDIPDYPTEQGFEVSDTITIHPLILNMTLFLSDTPVTWRWRVGAFPGRSDIVLARLEQAYAKRQLITVVTSKKTFKNMGITNIQISRSKDVGYPATFRLERRGNAAKVYVNGVLCASAPEAVTTEHPDEMFFDGFFFYRQNMITFGEDVVALRRIAWERLIGWLPSHLNTRAS